MKAESHSKGEGFLRVREALVENLKVAQAMEQLERLFVEAGVEPVDGERVSAALREVPERWRHGVQKGLAKYHDLRADARRCKDIVDVTIAEHLKYPLVDKTWAHIYFAKAVFEEMTGRSPNLFRYLSCTIEGPYLFLECDEENYAKFYAAGHEDWRESKGARASGGCYSYVYRLKAFNDIPISVIAYKRYTTDKTVKRRTIDHETQHFINHEIFGMFEHTEVLSDTNEMRKIKDELLAKIRSALSYGYVANIAENEIYKPLFVGLNSDQHAEAVQAAQVLAKFMEKWGYYLTEGGPSRAELVYRLAPVKLKDWPQWLALMDRYDEHRMKRE